MRLRLVAALVAVCLCGMAQTTLTIQQLRTFLKSSAELKQDDRQVARFLAKVKLTQKLDDRMIEDMLSLGIGPRTVDALKGLRDATAGLAEAPKEVPKPAPRPIPPPSAEEQKRVLDEARENALNYSQTLPDFICTQVTRRYFDPTGTESWHLSDTLTSRLSYFEQKENYKLLLINDRMTNQSYESLGGAISTGEFGSMLRGIFDPQTLAEFQWDHWASLHGRVVYVFAYRVAQANSQWSITYGKDRSQHVIAGYRGRVYIERDTHMILRLTLEAQEIPATFPVQEATTLLDYDYSKISEHEFLLPLKAMIRMRSDKYLSKNDVEFRRYQKFSADATVTFDTPAPLPEDKEPSAK